MIILKCIFFMILLFDVFMASPFGCFWDMKHYDEGKPCYGIITMFVTAIPLMVIGSILGYIY